MLRVSPMEAGDPLNCSSSSMSGLPDQKHYRLIFVSTTSVVACHRYCEW